MFNEYGCNWPFWGEDGLLEQDHFPLPPDLTQDVLAWTRNFNQHLSLIHISEPTRRLRGSRMPSSA